MAHFHFGSVLVLLTFLIVITRRTSARMYVLSFHSMALTDVFPSLFIELTFEHSFTSSWYIDLMSWVCRAVLQQSALLTLSTGLPTHPYSTTLFRVYAHHEKRRAKDVRLGDIAYYCQLPGFRSHHLTSTPTIEQAGYLCSLSRFFLFNRRRTRSLLPYKHGSPFSHLFSTSAAHTM
jgi:hypothetical protein